MSHNFTATPADVSSSLLWIDESLLSPKYAVSFITVILGLAWVSWKQWGGKPKLIPGVYVVGGSSKSQIMKSRENFRVASKGMVLEGYERSSGNEFFYVPSRAGERLVMPSHFIEELKSAPMDKVDFIGIVRDLMEGDYTGIGHRSRLHPDTLKLGLTPKVSSMMPEVQDEVEAAFRDAFPPCDDWTEIELLPVFANIVARASSRMMGGKPLSRDEEWIQASIDFSHCALSGSQKIKGLHWLVRPLLAPWVREIRKDIPNCGRIAERVTKPLLEQRRRDNEWPNDFLTLLWDAAKGQEQEDKFLASRVLLTAFASIHTSTAAIMNFIMDLCEHPECIDIMKEEYSGLIDEKGFVPLGGFSRLPKMDSCMKESQRFWPATVLTFERIINEDLRLSNGLTVPAGHRIAVCNYGVNMDPNIFPEPKKFDGLRFEKLRQQFPALQGRTQFVACNRTSLNFGYGRHACPGRAFFAEEYKAIMIRLLETFEIKYPPGKSRPPTLEFETHYIVNPDSKVMFRRRKTASA
ncbi:cytochrome P450 monooxygenase [Nemania abortiva]|nr:cytochrome P450 monooxygenase [Nemania abortiva]